MFLKMRTACTVLLLLLSCDCLGLNKKADHPQGGSATPSNTNQQQTSALPDGTGQSIPVAPTAPAPPYEDTQPPSYEEAQSPSYEEAQPPSYEEAQLPPYEEAQPPSYEEAQPPSYEEATARK